MPAALRTCAATAAAVLLAACSSGTGSEVGTGGPPPPVSPTTSPTRSTPTDLATNRSPAGSPDICALISRAQARTALGVPVSVGINKSEVQPTAGVVGSCVYRATDVKAHPITLVNLAVLGTTIPINAFEKQIRTRAPEATSLPGLGDEAFTIPGVVFVYDGGLVLSLQVSTGADPLDPAKVVPLARSALERTDALR